MGQVLKMEKKPHLTVVPDPPETKKGGGGGDSIVVALSVERAMNGFIVRAVNDKDIEYTYTEVDRDAVFKRLNELI
jgi:hypothetical protein